MVKWRTQVHEIGDRFHPILVSDDGDECWVNGCCVKDKELARKIALNMQAAFNQGWQHATETFSFLMEEPAPIEEEV